MPSKGVDMIEARRKAALVKMGKGVERAGQSTRAVGMSQFSGGKTLKKNPENDLGTSHYTGEDLEKLSLMMTERKKLVKKIRRVTTLMRQKMLKNASINGNWYKLFKSYDRDNSGNISFAELAYVVYKELDISKLEMSLKELRSVWGVVDINGDNTVTVCVEINQCAGCTMTRPCWPPSSGEEPTSPRHRAGVASMAWRRTRRCSTNAP
jgi:hypothetical protein